MKPMKINGQTLYGAKDNVSRIALTKDINNPTIVRAQNSLRAIFTFLSFITTPPFIVILTAQNLTGNPDCREYI